MIEFQRSSTMSSKSCSKPPKSFSDSSAYTKNGIVARIIPLNNKQGRGALGSVAKIVYSKKLLYKQKGHALHVLHVTDR